MDEAGVHDETWRQIEGLVDRVAAASRADVAEAAFYDTLLSAAVTAGAALDGAVWAADAARGWRLLGDRDVDRRMLLDDGHATGPHTRFLDQVRAGGEPATAPPGTLANGGLAFAAPVVVEGRVERIVEVFQRPSVSPDATRNYLDVLRTLCDLAADFHRLERLRRLQDRESQWQQLERFAALVHRTLDLEATAFTVANEARRVVDCDRVTVALQRGSAHRVLAVSGLDVIDHRSTTIRHLTRLVNRVVAVREPVWYTAGDEAAAPEIDGAVQEYVDATHAKSVTVLPITEDEHEQEQEVEPRVLGAVVFEWLVAGAGDREQVEAVCRRAAPALRNALRYARIPGVALLDGLGRVLSLRAAVRATCWLVPLLVVAGVLLFVDAEFRVSCPGRLRPQTRRHVFAPLDGQVEQLFAKHSDSVKANAVVATLQSSDLEFEIARVEGEWQTATEQLKGLKASRLGTTPRTDAERDDYARRTADEERLQKLLANLAEQKNLLAARRDKLSVRSPLAGQVLTWDLADTLATRPVKRGQILMTVADTAGPWVVELDVPDKDIGHVLAARRDLGDDLPVAFTLATAPDVVLHGHIETIAAAAELDDLQQLSVPVTVAFARRDLANPRPGAGVTARISCGRRCLAYVWLHDLLDATRRWLFW